MTKQLSLLITILFFTVFRIQAQLITANPPFPTEDDSVTITFDASLGSGGLAGYSGDVYAHTGVITTESSSGSDWKHVKAGWTQNIPECKMVKIGDDLWQLRIVPDIKQYYNINEGETVLKLAFVFRSSDGSLTGKTETGGDIFYDVYTQGLNVQITLPEQRPCIVEHNDTLLINGSSSYADSTVLYIDNIPVLTTSNGNFSYSYTANEYGKHLIVAAAYDNEGEAHDSVSFFVRYPPVTAQLPAGIRDGINYTSDTTVVLSLYAPGKNYVFAIGDFNGWDVDTNSYFNVTPDGKHFWKEIDGLIPGKEYVFQYLVDGDIRIGDPYADKISDPWNDKYISSSTYPGLIQYPQGKTTGIAAVLQTSQEPYIWQTENFTPPAPDKLVVYELLVRDFTAAHTFDGVLNKLEYLKELGITAIELMPVSEFEGNISWGYNPNYYFAPDKYYGPKNELKKLIDECHKQGIAVIMDMVLNHAYGTCPLAMLYWDAEHNRPAPGNPWFNVTSPNPTYSWGNDFNHESSDTKRFVDSVNRYWMSEYKIDGFRFDFTKGFTNTPGDGNGYDQSRIDILKRMADSIWAFKPDAYVILEHFTANSEEKVLANYGMMIWGNSNYNYNEATMGWNTNSDFSWISYKKRGWAYPNVMGYMESHDEERLMYKNLKYGNSNGNYNIKDLNTALKRNEMAAAFFIPVPGPKMIWQFGELGYDYSINRCENGTISDECRTSPKPVRWDYYNTGNRRHLHDIYAILNWLKQNEPVFNTSDFSMSVSGPAKTIHLNSPDMYVTIVGNFDVKTTEVTPGFQTTGTWYDLLNNDSIEVTGVGQGLTLFPGEYHIYTTAKIDMPWVGVNEHVNYNDEEMKIFPNPTGGTVNILVTLPERQDIEVSVYSLMGIKTRTLFKGNMRGGKNLLKYNLNGLSEGVCFVLLKTANGKTISRKLVVKQM